MDRDEYFMDIALTTAAAGRGSVEPNPMVGAIIVRDGVELSRGRHEWFGGPHAEANAISAARRAGVDIAGATMYVTLEPCCHQGKTPPCTQAIIDAGLSRLVVAMVDPDQQVVGGGIKALQDAGVRVDVGVCQSEAQQLLKAYCKLRRTGRPWVICKWAQTSDGFLSLPPGCGRWISGPESRRRVHEIRSECDGILVGISTVLADDPLLTDRSRSGRRRGPLTRIVLDTSLKLPLDSKLVATASDTPVLVATAADPHTADDMSDRGVELLQLPGCERGVDVEALLDELGRRQYTYLLVEGGPGVLASFIDSGLADELFVFVSPQKGNAFPCSRNLPFFDIAEVSARVPLKDPDKTPIGSDTLLHYYM